MKPLVLEIFIIDHVATADAFLGAPKTERLKNIAILEINKNTAAATTSVGARGQSSQKLKMDPMNAAKAPTITE